MKAIVLFASLLIAANADMLWTICEDSLGDSWLSKFDTGAVSPTIEGVYKLPDWGDSEPTFVHFANRRLYIA